jgi:hypothetical protein
MDSNLFWVSDEQWVKIVPHLPTNQPGPKRDDVALYLIMRFSQILQFAAFNHET